VTEEYRTLRSLIRRHLIRIGGDTRPDPPIISGEWGYTSAKLKHGGFTEEQQASYLPRQWLSNIANGIPISIWYDWHDDGDDRSNPEHNFGTVRRPYREGQAEIYEPKPAYVAAKTLTSVLKGYEFSKALALKDDEHVLLFAKGDQLRLAVWTSAKDPRTVRVPANAGRFRVTGHLGKELPEVIADDKGLTLTLTGDVQYLAPINANPSLRLAVAWERLPLEVAVTAAQPGELVRRTDVINKRDVIGPPPLIETILTHFRNPLEGPVRVGPEQAVIAFGASFPVRTVMPIGERAPLLPPTAVDLRINDAVVWTQSTRLVINNPITLHLLCPISIGERAVLPLLVDNRLGTAFSAVFTIETSNQKGMIQSDIPQGQQPVVYLPLARFPDGPFTASVHLHDPRNKHLIRSLPTRTYRMLPLASTGWDVHPDGDHAVVSTQGLAESSADIFPEFGKQPALDLTYRMDKGWKFLRLAPKAPLDLGASQEFGMWIHGDGSGNVVRMRVIDASGQVFQPDGGKLTHIGWKWTVFTLTPHTAHWGGANDGVVKPPLKLDTLFLLDQADQSKPSQGTVRIAGAMAME
jgi:polysaccharide biosynthesis protein PslG